MNDHILSLLNFKMRRGIKRMYMNLKDLTDDRGASHNEEISD